MTRTLRRPAVAVVASIALLASASHRAAAQTHITTPKEEFGANFGDDYFLANYKQIAAYWHKLDRAVRSHGRARDRQDRRGPRRS